MGGVRGNSRGGGSLSRALVPPGGFRCLISPWQRCALSTCCVVHPLGLASLASAFLCSWPDPNFIPHLSLISQLVSAPPVPLALGRHKNNKPPFPFWGFHRVLSGQGGHAGDLWAIEVLPYLALACTSYYIPCANTLFLAPTCSLQILQDFLGGE